MPSFGIIFGQTLGTFQDLETALKAGNQVSPELNMPNFLTLSC
jgi:hypothetical protein